MQLAGSPVTCSPFPPATSAPQRHLSATSLYLCFCTNSSEATASVFSNIHRTQTAWGPPPRTPGQPAVLLHTFRQGLGSLLRLFSGFPSSPSLPHGQLAPFREAQGLFLAQPPGHSSILQHSHALTFPETCLWPSMHVLANVPCELGKTSLRSTKPHAPSTNPPGAAWRAWRP